MAYQGITWYMPNQMDIYEAIVHTVLKKHYDIIWHSYPHITEAVVLVL